VLLDKHSFLAKNQKLAPKWSGPHKILRLKGDCNVVLLLRHNKKKLITHVSRLKPYFVQKPASATHPRMDVQEAADENFFPYDEHYPSDREVTCTDPTPSRPVLLPQQRYLSRRKVSSSSSLYGNSPEVSASDPSPAVMPEHPKIYMPEISFDPLPVLKEGEGL